MQIDNFKLTLMLTHLPDEILVAITKHLPTGDRLCLSETNKRFNSFIAPEDLKKAFCSNRKMTLTNVLQKRLSSQKEARRFNPHVVTTFIRTKLGMYVHSFDEFFEESIFSWMFPTTCGYQHGPVIYNGDRRSPL